MRVCAVAACLCLQSRYRDTATACLQLQCMLHRSPKDAIGCGARDGGGACACAVHAVQRAETQVPNTISALLCPDSPDLLTPITPPCPPCCHARDARVRAAHGPPLPPCPPAACRLPPSPAFWAPSSRYQSQRPDRLLTDHCTSPLTSAGSAACGADAARRCRMPHRPAPCPRARVSKLGRSVRSGHPPPGRIDSRRRCARPSSSIEAVVEAIEEDGWRRGQRSCLARGCAAVCVHTACGREMRALPLPLLLPSRGHRLPASRLRLTSADARPGPVEQVSRASRASSVSKLRLPWTRGCAGRRALLGLPALPACVSSRAGKGRECRRWAADGPSCSGPVQFTAPPPASGTAAWP